MGSQPIKSDRLNESIKYCMRSVINFALSCISVMILFSFQPVQSDNTLTTAEIKDGWKLLFDGTTMNGWRSYRNKTTTSWEVSQGQLHARANITGLTDKRSDIITTDQYGDFELSIDWKISHEGNSGILYHVTEEFEGSYKSGPEYQLIDDEGFPEHLEDWQKTAADYAMHPTTSRPTNPAGEYNHSRIIFKAGHVEHWLNGIKVVEFQAWTPEWFALKAKGKWKDVPGYGMAKKGFIALQDHGSEVWFRNIKIKAL